MAIFAVLIVPGLLLASGYNRTRAHALPQLDLYALARAIALSLGWLPVVWVFGGSRVIDWIEAKSIVDHQPAVLFIVVLNLALALAAGLLAGRAIDAIGSSPQGRLAPWIRWTGAFEPPTAWDYAWSRVSEVGWAAVEVTTATGDTYNVLFDSGSKVGLSPNPREGFFDTEFTLDGDELEVQDHEGIFIEAGQVIALRFLHIEPWIDGEEDPEEEDEPVDGETRPA